MNKRKVLIPIDGSVRSLESIKYLKEYYDPNKVEPILLHVGEIVFVPRSSMQLATQQTELAGKRLLDKASKLIEEYDYKAEFAFGYISDEILKYAEENNVDIILMAKNTKKKFSFILGSVTADVAKRVKCTLVIVPQNVN